jgi:hypothetical protein
LVAVSNKIICELKEIDWKPQQANRFNFAKYCQRIKKVAQIPAKVELKPHTGRRAWATYQAENGMPLPLLANMLGHSSQKTTAEYYWKNIYESNKRENILLGQKFAEKIDILKKIQVKDKNFWREYNAKPERKKYIQQKSKERWENKKKNSETTIKTTSEKLKAYQEHSPPKSRLEMSR